MTKATASFEASFSISSPRFKKDLYFSGVNSMEQLHEQEELVAPKCETTVDYEGETLVVVECERR